MDPVRMMTQTATITHLVGGGPKDEYGNRTSLEKTTEVRCWLHQTQRSEMTVEADTQIQTWQLFLPPGTSVEGSDRIRVENVPYELDGPPWPAFNPRLKRVTHIECTVKRVA